MFNVLFWIWFPQNDCSTEDLQIVGAEDLSFLAGKVEFDCQNQEHLLYTMVNSFLPNFFERVVCFYRILQINLFVFSSFILIVRRSC